MAKQKQKPEGPDRDYQAVLLHSPLGPKVLGKMLDSCHFGEIAISEEYQHAQNFMKVILDRCGISYVADGHRMVKSLMKKKEEPNGDE